jgi:hypothetical protein
MKIMKDTIHFYNGEYVEFCYNGNYFSKLKKTFCHARGKVGFSLSRVWTKVTCKRCLAKRSKDETK